MVTKVKIQRVMSYQLQIQQLLHQLVNDVLNEDDEED
jgi:hypothetical protein